MSYNYSQWVANLANMLVIDAADANYNAILPTIIDDAEQRVYRELDILNTRVRDATGVLTPNARRFVLPQSLGRFVVTDSMNVFPTAGVRRQLVPTTTEFLDAVWGNSASSTVPSIPQYYAMLSDQNLIVGPPPDAAYSVEVIGTIRPTPLSASNPTTYLTLYLPDIFFTASLVFGYGYLKDFGASTDDPNAPASWETHLKTELASANTEEQRKRYASQAWTAKQPAPLATPPRA